MWYCNRNNYHLEKFCLRRLDFQQDMALNSFTFLESYLNKPILILKNNLVIIFHFGKITVYFWCFRNDNRLRQCCCEYWKLCQDSNCNPDQEFCCGSSCNFYCGTWYNPSEPWRETREVQQTKLQKMAVEYAVFLNHLKSWRILD